MADTVQILAGGLTGAVLNQFWNEARSIFSERRDGKLTAMFLAAELDAYAYSCAERRQDIGNLVSTDGEMGRPWHAIPELLVFADKTNWRALGMELTQRVVKLRAVILLRNKGLEADWEFGDPEDVISEASNLCVRTGYEAITLAAALRSKHKVKPIQSDDQWDVSAYLVAELNGMEERARLAKERAARRARAIV